MHTRGRGRGISWSSRGDEAEEKQRSSDVEEPEEKQRRHGRGATPSGRRGQAAPDRPDAPDWIVRVGSSSRNRRPPEWSIQGPAAVDAPRTGTSGLGGSSCMVKDEGKGRKMTGFQRHRKIVVLLDIIKASQTSMVD